MIMQKYLRLKKMNTTNNYRGHSELENSVFIQDKKDFIQKNNTGFTSIEKEECHSTMIIFSVKENVQCLHC